MEPVLIEIGIKTNAIVTAELEGAIRQHIEASNISTYSPGMRIPFHSNPTLRAQLTAMRVDDVLLQSRVAAADAIVELCPYQLHLHDPFEEIVDDNGNGGEDAIPACEILVLPNDHLDGLWDSLYYDTTLKRDLVCYAFTSLLFSDAGVDHNVISTNRVVLLHGEPGTGKTSICKALTQKLSIRMRDRYPTSQLVEINAHSLFSKWFSESGKQVMMLFRKIKEIVEDPQCLVFVLIDEVESLAAARRSAMKGNEPSDAIRVVNALLTQLDSLRRYPNVLILTTSNLSDAIDVAFVDRADFKQYIGPPTRTARYVILRSSLEELARKGLVSGVDDESTYKDRLLAISDVLDGTSGRFLRKLPFITFSYYLYKDMKLGAGQMSRSVSVDSFLSALIKTAEREKEERT
eukprot:PhM_4_TR3818/c0_g1_i1/m.91972